MDILTKKFLFANMQLCRMTGYSMDEIITLDMFKVNDPGSLPYIEEQLGKQIRGEITTAVDIPVKRKDGTVFFADINGSVVTYRGRKIVIGFFRDMTERKQAREELMNKNKELENYTYLVSHDLKEPIRSIHLFSQLIKKESWAQLSEESRDYLNRVLNASNRVGQMISDLLLLSRVGRKDITFSDVDVNDLIEAVKEDLARQIEDKKAVIKAYNLPVVRCQRLWMSEIFKNLISNAIKYNESSQPLIEISCIEQADDYEFTVADNGIGIPEKYHDAIFELFRRLHTREKYEGTGAGLAIVRSIVSNHHGKIWVDSSTSHGTTFKFTIPKNI